jgi:hypothetical protein
MLGPLEGEYGFLWDGDRGRDCCQIVLSRKHTINPLLDKSRLHDRG